MSRVGPHHHRWAIMYKIAGAKYYVSGYPSLDFNFVCVLSQCNLFATRAMAEEHAMNCVIHNPTHIGLLYVKRFDVPKEKLRSWKGEWIG